MKQTIEIEVPEGKKAILRNNTIVYEDLVNEYLPKTWSEFCENHDIKKDERYIDDYSVIMDTKRLSRSFTDRNLLPSRKAAEQHLALMQLHQLRDCYRQGWEPDWTDSYEKKYCIVKYKSELKVDAYFHTVYFFSFQSKALAEEFLSNYKGLIWQVGDLI